MNPKPIEEDPHHKPTDKLKGRVALITGGDSGIGRAIALLYAKEGADIAIVYLPKEKEDAERTCSKIEEMGRKCLKLAGDLGDPDFCRKVIEQTVSKLGKLDILINNAAEQHVGEGIEDVDAQQLERTYRTNFFGYFNLAREAVKHLKEGSTIINTTSVQGFRPKPKLMDYASTKAAIVNFTRSLAQELAEKGIRVNAVAPGPIWTPLIPATFPPDQVEKFGKDVPLGRPGQPYEVAASYLFLASERDSSYITGQVIHVNGGGAMFS